MGGSSKSKEQLVRQVEQLRQRVAELEHSVQQGRDQVGHYRRLFERTGAEVVYVDKEGRIKEISAVRQTILGYNPQDLIDKHFTEMEFFGPEELPRIQQLFAEVLTNQESSLTDIQVCRKDGELIYLEIKSSLVQKDGQIEGVYIVARDITQRKQAEDTLRRSEQRYQNLIEALNDGVVVENADNLITYVNRSFCEKLGYRPEALIGRPPTVFVHPGYIEMGLAQSARRPFEPTASYEQVLRSSDGRDIDVIVSVRALYNAAGEYEGSLTVITDITERMQAEEALRRREQRYQYLMDTMSDGVIIEDDKNRIVYVNKPFCQTLDYSEEALRGRPTTDIIHPEGIELYLEKTGQRPQVHKDSYEQKLRGKDGRAVPVIISVQALHNPAGAYEGCLTVITDITARKEVEKLLRQSEARFRAVLETSRDIIYRYNLINDAVEYVSPSVRRALGMSPKEYMAVNLEEFFSRLHPEDGPRVQEVFENMLKADALDDNIPLIEYRWMHKDGHYHWWSENRVLVRDQAGRPVAMVGTIRDVTELKKAQEMMRIKDKAIASSINAIAIADWETRLTYVNESFLKMWGYENSDEVLGQSVLNFWARPEEAKKIVDKLQTEGACMGNLVGKHQDGSLFDVQLSANLVADDTGRPICMMGSFIDITERRRAEERLKSSEHKFRLVFDNAMDGILLADMETKRLYTGNKMICRMLHYESRELNDLYMMDIHPLKEVPRVIGLFEKQARKDITLAQDVPVKRKDGHIFYADINATPVTLEGRIYLMGVFRDVTERRRTEAQLHQYREKMVRAERLAALGAIGASLAHQLNQPLTVIRLMLEDSQALLEKTSCPANVRENFKEGLKATAHAETIVRSFRNLAGAPEQPKIEEIDLQKIAAQIAQVLSESARQSRLQFIIEDMSRLPKIPGDPAELEQIFFMLMENAVQAADGAEDRMLTIRATLQDGNLILEFADNCGGIDPRNLDKIFDPFFTTKPRGKGTGLGLSIVRQILNQRGGAIRLENRQNQGAAFFVTLPW